MNARLSKNALLQERQQLKLYQRLLPSLDMKRRQMTLELEKAKHAVIELHRDLDRLQQHIGSELPMLADGRIDLAGLVKVSEVAIVAENLIGARVPKLERVMFSVAPYSPLIQPAWVDNAVERLQQAADRRLRLDVAEERVRLLAQALRRATQRVNLFERILIPTAQSNIKRIQIFLGDLERDAVIRSKLTKARH